MSSSTKPESNRGEILHQEIPETEGGLTNSSVPEYLGGMVLCIQGSSSYNPNRRAVTYERQV